MCVPVAGRHDSAMRGGIVIIGFDRRTQWHNFDVRWVAEEKKLGEPLPRTESPLHFFCSKCYISDIFPLMAQTWNSRRKEGQINLGNGH